MRRLLLAAALALSLPACAASRGARPWVASPGTAEWWTAPVPLPGEEDAEAEKEGGGVVDLGHTILLYLPNRVLDAFDMARAGVNVGPGIGGQVKATDAGELVFLSRLSAGVGLQGLRHLPVYASSESVVGAGPVEAGGDMGFGWYQSSTDIRVEAHPLLAGAHVAVDPVEILDFVAGLFTIDIREDDY
jgi:hypothetical protein